MMFDLDHFKSINDRFGHDVGDDALRIFGTTIATNMRVNDVVGRLGGEEFAAILPGGLDTSIPVGERVRIAFRAAGMMISGHAMGATVSIGAACAPASACEIGVLLTRADRALYRAKNEGRNRIAIEQPEEVRSLPSAAIAGCHQLDVGCARSASGAGHAAGSGDGLMSRSCGFSFPAEPRRQEFVYHAWHIIRAMSVAAFHPCRITLRSKRSMRVRPWPARFPHPTNTKPP